jgi:hypothetical protein
MEEIGHADWLDADPDINDVPHDYAEATVLIGVTGMRKHSPLITHICADESSMKPMMIILPHNIDIELALLGVQIENAASAVRQMGLSISNF